MNAVEVLEQAKALIINPKNWLQGTSAIDQQGNNVTPKDKTAICWCALGAIGAVCGTERPRGVGRKTVRLLDKASGVSSPNLNRDSAYYNDTHSHDEVMAMFDRAIELAKLEDTK